MYCSKCGTAIPDDGHFCPECGHSVDGTQSADLATTSPEKNDPATAASNPPAKKMALWKKLLLGAVAIVIVSVGLALFLTAGLTTVVDNQLASLAKGDFDNAYEQTASVFKSSTSRQEYEAFIRAHPILMNAPETSFSQRSVDNNVGTLMGTLTSKDGTVQPITFKFVKEGDEWRIVAVDLSIP